MEYQPFKASQGTIDCSDIIYQITLRPKIEIEYCFLIARPSLCQIHTTLDYRDQIWSGDSGTAQERYDSSLACYIKVLSNNYYKQLFIINDYHLGVKKPEFYPWARHFLSLGSFFLNKVSPGLD